MEMRMTSSYMTSSSGLPVYRVQFIDSSTGEEVVVSDIDIMTSADCVQYINSNPIIKEKLGFGKGDTINTSLYDFVERVMYPYYPPEITQIINSANISDFGKYVSDDSSDIIVYKQKGTVIFATQLSVSIMAGSKNLTKCNLVRIQNNKKDIMETKVLNIRPGAATVLTFKVAGFSNDTTYYFEVSDNYTTVESYKINYQFILPIYVGYAKDGLLDPTLSTSDLNEYLNALIKLPNKVDKRLVPMNQVQKGYFDIVAGQKDDVPKKPDPAGVNRILEEFGCKPEECLYFGDTNTDMQTGLNAKAHTVGVTWGFRDRAELEAFHPDFVIDDPKMVTNHILASFS